MPGILPKSRWDAAQVPERQYWERLEWQSTPREQRLAEWQRHLNPLDLSLDSFAEDRVLDVGCGPTGLIYFVTARSRLGLDPLARTYGRWNGYYGSKIELVAAMAENMPFGAAVFDAVFCINCIDHSHRPEAILTEIARVLRPGGRLIFHVDLDSPLRKLHKAVRPEVAASHPHSLSREWLFAQLQPRFEILNTARDEEVFRATVRQMRYEGYWDGLIHRLTGSDRWINHIWLSATRSTRSPT